MLDSVFASGGSCFLDAITECSSQLSGFRHSLWKQAGTTLNNIFKLITNRFYSTFSIDTCCDAIVLSVIPYLYNSTSGYTGISSSQIAVVMPDPLFTSSGRSLQAEMTSVPHCLTSKQGGLSRDRIRHIIIVSEHMRHWNAQRKSWAWWEPWDIQV
jgi:hypothetical protein